MTATSDFLVADARAALRRRLADTDRTELSRAFAAWLLREPDLKTEFSSLVAAAAGRKGAQQDFQTVAILGYGSEAAMLNAQQLDALKQGLRRQAGREPSVDGVPMAFCRDAVGILGIALGVKAVADDKITSEVARWAARFLKASYEMERAEDWHRCLFAAADQQLGSPENLAVPHSAALADVRTALVMRGILADGILLAEDWDQTLRSAVMASQAELPVDRAVLFLAAMEFVMRTATPKASNKLMVAGYVRSSMSPRDTSIHDIIGKERLTTQTNAEIMRDVKLKKRLQTECKLGSGDATKRSLDRIRRAKGYLLSRDLANKRAARN